MPEAMPVAVQQGLTAGQLLTLWEEGLGLPPWQRALVLLAAAFPQASPEDLARLPLGQRDARLLSLRQSVFGPRLTSLAACPSCAEKLELSFGVEDIRVLEPQPGDQEPLSLDTGEVRATFRLPNSLDLADISRLGDPAEARLRLAARCLISAEVEGEPRAASQLPGPALAAIADKMAAADPQAEVQIALSCPNCGQRWTSAFDILSYFWSEVDAWARRTLREVHLLASAYGWREADILALSPWRRQAYLQMSTLRIPEVA